jgi:hypothetical protein
MTERMTIRMARTIGVAVVSLLLIVGGALAANNLIGSTSPRDALPAASVAPGAEMSADPSPDALSSPDESHAPEASEAPEASGLPAVGGAQAGSTGGDSLNGTGPDDQGGLTEGNEANEGTEDSSEHAAASPGLEPMGDQGTGTGDDGGSSSTSDDNGGQG